MNGIRWAERGGESSMLLWQHEFYYVLEREESMGRKQAPPKPYLYQAIQFRKGTNLPLEEKEGLSRKQLGEMWAQGVAYAPARGRKRFFDPQDSQRLVVKCPERVITSS